MKTRNPFSRLLLLFLVLVVQQVAGCGGSNVSSQGTENWTGSVQLGTPMSEESTGITSDRWGCIFVGGSSEGDIDNCGCDSPMDGFLVKYDPAGVREWLFEVEGEEGCASIRSIATAADGSSIYAGGCTDGDLAGTGNLGEADVFLYKLGTWGNVEWVRQAGSAGGDSLRKVAVAPSGSVYLAGITGGSLEGFLNAGERDAFAIKIDSLGTIRWNHQFGTGGQEFAEGMAVDASENVYIVGRTDGALGGTPSGGYDMFVAKLDSSGSRKWILQAGTPEDEGAFSAAVDADGNIYVVGKTAGNLNGETSNGGFDLFLLKLDPGGTVLWTRLLGTTEGESGCAVAVDGEGCVYVAGATSGSLEGANAGGDDALLAKYDGDGERLWVRQFGTPAADSCYGVAIDPDGNIFCAGTTEGSIGGSTNLGASDVYVAKFDPKGNRF